MDFERSLLRQDAGEKGSFAAYMAISLGCHVIVVACLIMVSGFSGCQRRTIPSTVIDVDLVSLPDKLDAGSRSAEPIVSKKKTAVPEPVKKNANTPSPKTVGMNNDKSPKKVKRSLKEKTFNPGRSVDNAIARLEKKVEQEAPSDSVEKAISRLKKAEQDNRRSVTVSAKSGATGVRSQKELEAIEIYKVEIRYHILKNWVFSRQLAGTDEALKTVIGITIAADGSITDTWFDKRSGNAYFDDSAQKAVLKSNPLPKLPEGYTTYTVGLEFTPSDLQ